MIDLGIWVYSGPLGTANECLVDGSIWAYVMWVHLGPFGYIWVYLGVFGSIWVHYRAGHVGAPACRQESVLFFI